MFFSDDPCPKQLRRDLRIVQRRESAREEVVGLAPAGGNYGMADVKQEKVKRSEICKARSARVDPYTRATKGVTGC
jgi:hypothetical protein